MCFLSSSYDGTGKCWIGFDTFFKAHASGTESTIVDMAVITEVNDFKKYLVMYDCTVSFVHNMQLPSLGHLSGHAQPLVIDLYERLLTISKFTGTLRRELNIHNYFPIWAWEASPKNWGVEKPADFEFRNQRAGRGRGRGSKRFRG